MDGRDYDALARDVNLKHITSSKQNNKILRRLRDDDLDVLWIGEADTDYSEFVVREGDDLRWLGFYIGKCATLEELFIEDMPGDIDQIDEFLRGLNRNRSLQVLCINTDLEDFISEKLGDFLRHNKSLYELDLRYFDIGRESARKLAITLCDTSLKSLELTGNGLCKEGFADIVTEALLGPRALKLRELELRSNGLDDESLQLLAAGLTNNTEFYVAECWNTGNFRQCTNSSVACRYWLLKAIKVFAEGKGSLLTYNHERARIVMRLTQRETFD